MHSMAYNNKNARRACSIGCGNDTNGRASTARGCHTRDCPFEIWAELFSITLWCLLSALCNTRTLLICMWLCLSVFGCLWIRSKIIKPEQSWALESELSSHLLCRSRRSASVLGLSQSGPILMFRLQINFTARGGVYVYLNKITSL